MRFSSTTVPVCNNMGLCASAAAVQQDQQPAPEQSKSSYYARQQARQAEARKTAQWASWDSHRGMDTGDIVHGFAMATGHSTPATAPSAASASALAADTLAAVREAYKAMDTRLALPERGEKGETVMHNVTADALFVFCASDFSPAAVSDALVEVAPNVPCIHGVTSSGGVFSWEGLHIPSSSDTPAPTGGDATSAASVSKCGGITLVGVADADGTFATNSQAYDQHGGDGGVATVQAVAGCLLKMPQGLESVTAAYITCAPGSSDVVMAGETRAHIFVVLFCAHTCISLSLTARIHISHCDSSQCTKAARTALGEAVTLFGGEAGANTEGSTTTAQFTETECFQEGVVVTLLSCCAQIDARTVPLPADLDTEQASKKCGDMIDAGTAGMVYVVGRPEQAAELVRSMTDKIGHANNTPFCGMFGPRQIFSPGSGSAAEAEAAADANTLAMQITIFKKKEK